MNQGPPMNMGPPGGPPPMMRQPIPPQPNRGPMPPGNQYNQPLLPGGPPPAGNVQQIATQLPQEQQQILSQVLKLGPEQIAKLPQDVQRQVFQLQQQMQGGGARR